MVGLSGWSVSLSSSPVPCLALSFGFLPFPSLRFCFIMFFAVLSLPIPFASASVAFLVSPSPLCCMCCLSASPRPPLSFSFPSPRLWVAVGHSRPPIPSPCLCRRPAHAKSRSAASGARVSVRSSGIRTGAVVRLQGENPITYGVEGYGPPGAEIAMCPDHLSNGMLRCAKRYDIITPPSHPCVTVRRPTPNLNCPEFGSPWPLSQARYAQPK